MSQLLVRGGTCVNATGLFVADLLVDDGKIVAIGEGLTGSFEETVDARGKLVIPGGIDDHVHLPWPSGDVVSTDDFSSGTKAAAFGGVTTILDFVIPDPDQPLEGALQSKLKTARDSAWVDFGLHLNIRGEVDRKIAEVPDLVEAGFISYKAFMAYEGFRLDDSKLLRVLRAVAAAGGVLMVHAENGLLADHLTAELVEKGDVALSFYPQSRPPACEIEAIHRIITFVRQFGARLHIVHVSTAQGAEMVGSARREGLHITGETCPHYLVFADEDYRGDPSRASHLICAPSIKSAEDRDALWEALAAGSLSMVATDHCPYTREQKEASLQDFTRVPGGMAGVETRLPLLFDRGVRTGRLSLERFVEVTSTGAARAFGLFPRKGVIAVGSDADLVVFDPDRKVTLHASDLHMNSDCLSYEGMRVQGWPETVILRGRVVVDGGDLRDEQPAGMLIPRRPFATMAA
jgi:dihydropyrimidinase